MWAAAPGVGQTGRRCCDRYFDLDFVFVFVFVFPFFLQSPDGLEVLQWLPANVTVPVWSQNKSNGRLAKTWLFLMVSFAGAVEPPGRVITRMPPDPTLALLPLELPVTWLLATLVLAAPNSPMPIPDTGGSPSSASPGQALLLL